MYKVFQSLLARIRFYIFLLGAFLGLEIPLIIFTYFKIFPRYRNFVWIITILMGLLTAYIVHYMIQGIIKEDYRIKILFDTKTYDEGDSNEKI